MSRLWRADAVTASLAPHRWSWAEANRERIAAHWARRKAERPAIFDGRVLMLSGVDDVAGHTVARFFETGYAEMTAWLDLGRPGEGVGNGFAMGALRGSDGGFILGRMANHTANAGHLYFPAGTPDLGDVTPEGEVDLAGSMLREITEETGLGPDDWTVAPRWTVVEEDGRVAFLREIHLSVPAVEACRYIRNFLATETRPELAGVEIVTPGQTFDAAIPPYLRTYLGAASADQTS